MTEYNEIFPSSSDLTKVKIDQITRWFNVEEIKSHLKKSMLQELGTFDKDWFDRNR